MKKDFSLKLDTRIFFYFLHNTNPSKKIRFILFITKFDDIEAQ